MSNHIYKHIELTGSSEEDLESAIRNAITKASESLHGMRWFEVTDTRGHIEHGRVTMKIIILGAGQVGGTLAEHLASEANDITVVDTDGERLRDLSDRLDIRTVQGRGSFPTVLRQAGATMPTCWWR
jgi:flavin-binding protein dodecin